MDPFGVMLSQNAEPPTDGLLDEPFGIGCIAGSSFVFRHQKMRVSDIYFQEFLGLSGIMNDVETSLPQRKKVSIGFYAPKDFSDEEMARDWSLSDLDKKEIANYWMEFRTFVAASFIYNFAGILRRLWIDL